MNNEERPTLGILPKKFWLEDRINELAGCIRGRFSAGQDVPQKWIDEYNEIVKMYNDCNKI